MVTLPSALLRELHDRLLAALGEDVASRGIADRVIAYLCDTAETTVSVEHLPADLLLPGIPGGGPSPEAPGSGTVATTFVITGDIPAMWLRDSAAQLAPLLRLVRAGIGSAEDRAEITALLAGLLRRQWRQIALDPYANAFNRTDDGARWDDDDTDASSPWLWERKLELDSLSWGPDLAWRLLRTTGDPSFLDAAFVVAAGRILDTVETEQDHEARSPYFFRREGCPPSDTLARHGRGGETAPCGLVWSGFRPSDDACALGFNIPGNHYLALALERLGDLLEAVPTEVDGGDCALGLQAERARELSADIRRALAEHGTMRTEDGIEVRAYEVDGQGDALFMDDANVPSLLALPYLGCVERTDPLTERTREAVLSPANPYYVAGSVLAGVGSPHTPPDHVWPIALSIEGLTSGDPARQRELLEQLMATDGGTGMMHEGVHVDDPTRFTRPWFSWSNAMFCELALELSGIGTD